MCPGFAAPTETIPKQTRDELKFERKRQDRAKEHLASITRREDGDPGFNAVVSGLESASRSGLSSDRQITSNSRLQESGPVRIETKRAFS